MLKEEKLALAKRFKMEDLGELHYVLGMSVKCNRRLRTLSIGQTKYLEVFNINEIVIEIISYGFGVISLYLMNSFQQFLIFWHFSLVY